METNIKLETKDHHIIYGTLNYNKVNKKTLLIFVHGLTGNQREHQYFNAVPFFTNKGFDTFRFDFYSRGTNARKLSDCSFLTHVIDLELVINYFKLKYEKLILIGHSIGAIIILKTDLSNISKIILWDPTKGVKTLAEKKCVYNKKIDRYILNWAKEIIVGKKMIDDWKKSSNLIPLLQNITKPCNFIFAEKNPNLKTWKILLNNLEIKYAYSIIKGASHTFTEEGTEQKLFSETLKWIS